MPRRKPTTYALLAVGIYLLVTAGIAIYAIFCTTAFCGIAIVLPMMPWIMLLEPFLPDSPFTLLGLVLLNSLIVYVVVRYFVKAATAQEASVDQFSQY